MRRRRRLGVISPEDSDVSHLFAKSPPVGRLHKVTVGAHFVGLVHVLLQVGAGHDNYWDEFHVVGRCLVQPLEKLKSGNSLHLQIQQDDVGQREGFTVVVRRLALQIIHGLCAIFDMVQPEVGGFVELHLDELSVIRIILDQQEVLFVFYVHGAPSPWDVWSPRISQYLTLPHAFVKARTRQIVIRDRLRWIVRRCHRGR